MKECLDEEQGRESEPAPLRWPPAKGDLRRLYLDEKLSAMKISRLYGLKYPNPKSGESMVLYYLKRFGIERRDRAEHIRKVTEEMANEWVRRYEAGESLKQIAGVELSPVTVFNHLHRRGIKLRDKIAALIDTITKHPKTPFSGHPLEKAYLTGFAQGDLYVTRHGRAVRVKTGTTHPGMAELFSNLFGRYGPVYLYPRKAKLTKFEWSLDADLDGSFEFFLHNVVRVPASLERDTSLFYNYISGLFDAEGSIVVRKRRRIEVSITNSNLQLLQDLSRLLASENITFKIRFKDRSPLSGNVVGHGKIWRHAEALTFLQRLRLRHPERCAKAKLAIRLLTTNSREAQDELLGEWEMLRAQLKSEREKFIHDAERKLAEAETSSRLSD